MYNRLFNLTITRVALLVVALMAISLVALPVYNLAFAQETDTIEYAENGTGPVATFTGVDPENAGAVSWSLVGDDANDDDEDFAIGKDDGVLSFMESPDYEMATGGGDEGTANTYTVTVVATDADGQMSMEAVTIEVTNVDEAGTVTLDKVAPYPGILLTAMASDPDNMVANSDEWQWSKSMSRNGSYTEIADADAADYTPTDGDVNYYLRATVEYDDQEGDGKRAMMTSAHQVQAINVPNALPVFPDQNTATTRMIGENADAGMNVGDPVVADDANNDILTYTLGGTNADAFEIDPATGQITVGDDTELNFEGTPSYTVTVTATDPAGANAEITVTINLVDDENEPPAITGTVPASFNEGIEGSPLTGGALTVVTFTADNPNDASPITWSLSGEDAGDFTITDGDLTFIVSPNYEMPHDADGDNVYKVTVSATDADRNRGEMEVEVKVANMEEDGTVTLSALQPRVGIALTASLTDIDGGEINVEWQWSNNADIDGATSDTYTPTSDDQGDTLTAKAMYTDAQGPEKTAQVVSAAVAVDTRNKAPEFPDQDTETEGTQNTEAERTIAENSAAPASVDGGAVTATDPNDGDELTYTLGGPDASSFDIGSGNGQIMVGAGTELDYETKQTYMVTVIATDSFGVSASIDVTIMVTNVNEGPTINGPAEADYAENGTGPVATFTGVDPENAGAVSWSLVGDDANDDDEDFAIGKDDGVLSFMESPDYEMATGGGDEGTANTYTVTVVATDADGQMSMEAVTIEVTNVDEAGTVTLDKVAPYPGILLTAMASDPDNVVSGSEEWQWSKSMSRNGSYTEIADADAADYTPTSNDVDYYLRATVEYDDQEGDGKRAMMTSAHQVQSFNSPNALPVFPDQDPDTDGDQNTATTRMIGENADAGMNVGDPVVADDANNDILTYTLGGTNADAFEIDPATGQITVGDDTELNFEGTPSYTVTVTATDPAGANAEITVTINLVDDENEPPAITGTVPASFNEGIEGSPLTGQALEAVDFTAADPDNQGTITWSLSGEDAGDFTITDGDLTFIVSPNYEMPHDADGDNVYKVTVSATDADRNRGEMEVEVKVANMEEDGTVTLSAVQPRVGIALTASLTDIDGGEINVEWQWSNNADIDGATSDTYTPTSDDQGDTLTAKAMYTDAQGPEKTAQVVSAAVAVDTRNKAPEFPDQDTETEGTQNTEAERTIAENSAAPASVDGGAVTATDPNDGDVLTYTLGGPDASSFDIGSGNGQIMVGAGTELDYETKQTYMVTVIATDSFGVSASIDVTIMVTNVNEGPTIMRGGLAISGPSSIDYAENGTGPVETYTASGPDAASAVWSVSGADEGDFMISAAGVLTFRASPDYEMPADMDMDNMYMVTVNAYDGTTMAERSVIVMVTDVADDLAISGLNSIDYAENGTGPVETYTASGPNAASAVWSVSGADEGDFMISAAGVLTFRASPDYEMPADMDMDNMYMVTVNAYDGTTMAERSVIVMVTDVADDLAISGLNSIDYAENGTGPVETYTASGPNAASATWSLSGYDEGDFMISAAGVLTFRASPDYEMPADMDMDNMYMVTVNAYDGTTMAERSVIVMVTDVDDTAPVETTLLERYGGDDGMIDVEEVGDAIDDHFYGTGANALSQSDLEEVLDLHFFPPQS